MTTEQQCQHATKEPLFEVDRYAHPLTLKLRAWRCNNCGRLWKATETLPESEPPKTP